MTLPEEFIAKKIYLIRDQKVMIDSDLSAMYRVNTKALNQAVKRNLKRFPDDFMFQLNNSEYSRLRFQNGTSKDRSRENDLVLRSQIVTSKQHTEKRGGRQYLPYVFTEQGIAMLSSVLNSDRAIQVNIQIMRVFVKMKELALGHKDILLKLKELEEEHNQKFKSIFEAIDYLMKENLKAKQKLTTKPAEEKKFGFRIE